MDKRGPSDETKERAARRAAALRANLRRRKQQSKDLASREKAGTPGRDGSRED
jgi:hypothetical protein